MKRIYFDTSALIKEFVSEVGSDLIDKVTTSAREGNLQIISSVWAINEAIGVIDRKVRKGEINQIEVQKTIATISERIKDTSINAAFFFAPIEHEIVAKSRLLIDEFHISPDDALHLYTAWIFDTDYFLVHDDKIIDRIRGKVAEGMQIIDLGDEEARKLMESELGL